MHYSETYYTIGKLTTWGAASTSPCLDQDSSRNFLSCCQLIISFRTCAQKYREMKLILIIYCCALYFQVNNASKLMLSKCSNELKTSLKESYLKDIERPISSKKDISSF